MIYTIDEIQQHVMPIAKKYKLHSVYIFGSYARNEATEASDIDLLVNTTGSVIEGWVIGGLYNELSEAFGNSVDLVTSNALEQNNDRTPWFKENIMRDRILLYEQ
jgi:predicted nucleotidyltransferase